MTKEKLYNKTLETFKKTLDLMRDDEESMQKLLDAAQKIYASIKVAIEYQELKNGDNNE